MYYHRPAIQPLVEHAKSDVIVGVGFKEEVDDSKERVVDSSKLVKPVGTKGRVPW